MTLESQSAYSTEDGGCFRYTNIRAFVFGGIQIILGIMAIGSGIIMVVMQSLGWVICLGFWGGGILLASGLFSVKASSNREKSNIKIAMGLGIAGFVVSVGLVLLGVAGLYVDGVDDTALRRVDSALSMGPHIINLFAGGWGCVVTLFTVGSTWPYVVGDKPFMNTVGPDSDGDPLTGGPPVKLSKEEAAALKKQKEEEKKRKKQEEKERKQREKEEKERKKKEEQEAKKRKKAEEEEAKRLKKEEEARKKAEAAAAAAGAGGRRATRRSTVGGAGLDEEPDSDFEYDSDEFDDDDIIEGETAEERKRRRRQKAWQLHIKKRYITGKDPFSKDRVYNKTWEKKSKEEFKETKAQALRRKMMEEKMKK